MKFIIVFLFCCLLFVQAVDEQTKQYIQNIQKEHNHEFIILHDGKFSHWLEFLKVEMQSTVDQSLTALGIELKQTFVDLSKEEFDVSNFNIKSYPAVIYSYYGKKMLYQGKISYFDYMAFVHNRHLNQLLYIDNEGQADQLIDETFVIAIYQGPVNKIKEILQLKEEFPHVKFAIADQKNEEQFVVYKHYDEGKVVYNGPIQHEMLKKFMSQQVKPKHIPFDHRVQKILMGQGWNIIMLIFPKHKIIPEVESIFRKAQAIVDGDLIFVVETDLDLHWQKFFRVDDDSDYDIVMYTPNPAQGRSQVSHLDKELSVYGIQAFISQILE